MFDQTPCPHRFRDFDALECWSGNCYQAGWELLDALRDRRDLTPVPGVQHPEGYGLRWTLVNWWHRLRSSI
jgi:hypothetical protein